MQNAILNLIQDKMQNLKWLTGLVMLGVVLCLPNFAHATPTTNLLIVDTNNHRVIEVDADHNIVWQYGETGVSGSGPNQLYEPAEAVKLTNGHILIVDCGYEDNRRVLEISPTGNSGGTILWEYKGHGGGFIPVDVKKLPNGNVLIADNAYHRILEVTPVGTSGANLVWKSDGISLYYPNEAEKRGTNTYLITDTFNHRIIEVEASGASGGAIIWQYGQTGNSGNGANQLSSPMDAIRLIGNSVLITDKGNHRVIEVQPTGANGGTIVWECSANTGLSLNYPMEAIRMSNWNTLIADTINHRVMEVCTADYPSFTPASILWQQGQTGISGTGTNRLAQPYDVEELGIINIAKAEYEDANRNKMPTKFAGVVVPITPPTVNLPEIELYKSVDKKTPQQIGATLTYTISYENKGNGTATDVVITDMVSDSTEYIINSAKIVSGPSATFEFSHDGGINFDGSQLSPVTHIRWNIIGEIAPSPSGFGTLEFQVVIK